MAKLKRPAGRPSGQGGQAKVPSADERARVDQCLRGTRTELRDRAMFLMQYATGMRAGELAALKVADLIVDGRLQSEFRLGTEDTKYCRARTIYLEHKRTMKALTDYLKSRRPDLSFHGTEPLFVGQKLNGNRDRRLPANTVVQIFARMYERAGVVGASSHSGRRWFMTELAKHGVHPRVIQKRAGHSSLATTQRYIEVTPDQERLAVRTIEL